MDKQILYYTDNQLREDIAVQVMQRLKKCGVPIVSVSLKPLRFGKNYVFHGERGYVSMIRQIIMGLENCSARYVFFCEHDVLYNKTHFAFTPPRDDIFYYNENVWRWWYGDKKAVRHDRMIPLSAMCCDRELAYWFYRHRWEKMLEVGLDKFKNPQSELMRKWGFEPGTKKKKRGGLTDDEFETWRSEKPIIDIRHHGTFSPAKMTIESFKHKPTGWEETAIENIL